MDLKTCLILSSLCLFLAGCVTVGQLKESADAVTQDEIATLSAPVSALLSGVLDDPLNSLASGGLGYIICLLRNLYKTKKRKSSS